MPNFNEKIKFFHDTYEAIKNDNLENSKPLPGKNYFLSDNSVLAIPRNEGESRFPYGRDGFNFWTYASGYMHANEGLFSPFLRAKEGQEPVIAFFAGKKNEDKYDVLPLLAVPEIETNNFGNVERFTIFDVNCTYYICRTDDFDFTIRVFVDSDNKVNFTIQVDNKNSSSEEIYLAWYFNPMLNHSISDNDENRWFRQTEFEDYGDLGRFVFKVNEDLSRSKSVTNFAVLNQGISGENYSLERKAASSSRYNFVGGAHSSLYKARALENGVYDVDETVTAFTETSAASELAFLNLEQNAKVRVDIKLNYIVHCKEDDAYKPLFKDIDIAKLEKDVEKAYHESEENDKSLLIHFDTSEIEGLDAETLTHFMKYLKKQVEFCASIKGFIQLSLGSLIGIRDVYQAIEAVLFYEPELARAKMLESLEFIDPSGRAPRQYSLPTNEGDNPIMDLRPFIDQGHWIIDTFVTYIKYTGDFSILDEELAYYEIIDERGKIVAKTDYKDSALQHMLKVMDFLISNIDPDTKCLKALFGDWNDALDGLGVSKDPNKDYGNGVSVMASLQLYKNLEEMAELLNHLGVHEEEVKLYQKTRAELKEGLLQYAVLDNGERKHIAHGWGEDRDYYVAGFNDPDGVERYGLTAPAFWVISRLYEETPELRDVLVHTFETLDSKYGLKTFEPGFAPGTPGVGRIPKLPIGTAENGAVYIHGSVFGTAALFAMGESKMAWEELVKNLPFTAVHETVSHTPFVMPNSYGYNPELNIDGESMNDWQTGSSNVVLKIILYFVFGIRFEYDGIRIQTAANNPFKSLDLQMKYRGKSLNLALSKDDSRDSRAFKLNGSEMRGNYDENYRADVLFIKSEDLENLEQIDIEVIN